MKIQNGVTLKPPSAEEATVQRDARLHEAAQMYEAHFLNEMVKAMRRTVDSDNGLIKRNFAEKIFSDQLDSQNVEKWVHRGGVGIADLIYDQIRERFGSGGTGGARIHGALPLAPRGGPVNLPAADAIKVKSIPAADAGAALEYRFEVPQATGAFDVLAPMGGRLAAAGPLSDGWQCVRLDHGPGLESEMTFPGRVAPIVVGQILASGQRLGEIESERPVLAWKLDGPKA